MWLLKRYFVDIDENIWYNGTKPTCLLYVALAIKIDDVAYLWRFIRIPH